MFTRSSSTEVHSLEPPRTTGSGSGNAQQQPRQRPLQAGAKSVIGNDLKIVSEGTLQVDGEIEGDVGGAEVIIGELGRVTGTVAADRVIVRGTISGVIRGAAVTLQSSSHVEGDIHHISLAIEQGAEFDGRCRRAADASALRTDLGA